MYPFIILCGGFATRLGEIAVETPKCLLKLNNKPFLLYQLEYLDKNGAKDVFLSVGGYRPEFWPCEDIDLWARFIDSGYKLKVQQEYQMKYRLHNRSTWLKNFHNNLLCQEKDLYC